MGLRTSSEASRMNEAIDLVPPSWRCSRSRRVTFSTPTIASSTTTPAAITKPASTITLIDAPRQ
jgi:hypothetical protein